MITTEAPLGEVAQITDSRIALAQRVILLRGRSGFLFNDFLAYALQAPEVQHDLASRATGTTVLGIRQSELRRVMLPVPSLPEQQAIAAVLSSLDDKIELNREMNGTLEAMAQTIFRSWFVDFDPVVAKADGREPFGMDAETAALFPNRFVDSELGAIPEGWEAVPTDSLGHFVNGRAFTKNATGTGRMVIRITELNGGPRASTIYNDLSNVSEDHLARPGDILFAWSGSLGVYRWLRPEAIINQHIFKVIPTVVPNWLAYHHLVDVMPFYRRIAAGKATTMGHIKRSHLSETRVALPGQRSIIDAADALVAPLWAMWLNNDQESQTLTELRDLLLPKLLSGELRIPEAEDLVKDIA